MESIYISCASFIIEALNFGLGYLKSKNAEKARILNKSLSDLERDDNYKEIGQALRQAIEKGGIKVQDVLEEDSFVKEFVPLFKQSEFFIKYSSFTDKQVENCIREFLEIFKHNMEASAGSSIELVHEKLNTILNQLVIPTGSGTTIGYQGEKRYRIPEPTDLENNKELYLKSLFSYGFSLENKGELEEAERKYDEFLKCDGSENHPDHYKVLTNKGRFLLERREMEAALNHFERAYNVKPTEFVTKANLATAYAVVKRTDEAFTLAQEAFKINDKEHVLLNTLALIYADKGNYERAFELTKQSINIEINFWPAYANLGLLYADKGDFKNAIGNINKAIQGSGEKDPGFFVTLGSVLLRQFQDSKGSKRIKGENQDFFTVSMKDLDKNTQEQDRMLTDAKGAFEKAISMGVIAENYMELLINLASCYQFLGEYDNAEKLYGKTKDDTQILQSLGSLYLKKGNFNKSRYYYIRYLRSLSRNERQQFSYLYANIAKIYLQPEKLNLSKALYYINRAVTLSPENLDFLRNKAIVLAMQGKRIKSNDILTGLRNRGYDDSGIALILGRNYYRERMFASAKIEYKKTKKSLEDEDTSLDVIGDELAYSAAFSQDSDIAYQEFKRLAEKEPDNLCYVANLANAAYNIHKTPEDKEYARKAIQLAKTIKNVKQIATLINNMMKILNT